MGTVRAYKVRHLTTLELLVVVEGRLERVRSTASGANVPVLVPVRPTVVVRGEHLLVHVHGVHAVHPHVAVHLHHVLHVLLLLV